MDDQHLGEVPRSGIVWIASYPASGSREACIFLQQLIQQRNETQHGPYPVGIDRISVERITKRSYADLLGFRPTDAHRDEVAKLRPRVQQRIAVENEGMVIIETRDAFLFERGYPTVNTAVTAGAVYIVRNPLEVALSYAAQFGRNIDAAIQTMAMKDAEGPDSAGMVYEVHGSWSQHVWGWTRKPNRGLLVIRHEDMLSEPEATFGGLARHVLLDVAPEQLKAAIQHSSTQREAVEHFGEGPQLPAPSFQSVRPGQWRDLLTPVQIQQIIKDHDEQMRRFGYLTDAGTPI